MSKPGIETALPVGANPGGSIGPVLVAVIRHGA